MSCKCICIAMRWNAMRNSLYSSSSRALTFPDFLIRQMDLLLMSVLDLSGPSTAMPANKRGSRVHGQYADVGSDRAFKVNMPGLFIEAVCLSTCVRAVPASFRCDLKSKGETSGVCLRGCKHSRSRMLLFTHVLKGLCSVTQVFILTSVSLFLKGCPGSQASRRVLADTGLSSIHAIIERISADINPSHYPSDGSRRCSSSLKGF